MRSQTSIGSFEDCIEVCESIKVGNANLMGVTSRACSDSDHVALWPPLVTIGATISTKYKCKSGAAKPLSVFSILVRYDHYSARADPQVSYK